MAGSTSEDAYVRAFGTARDAKAKGEVLETQLAGYIRVIRQQHQATWNLLAKLTPPNEWRKLENPEEVEVQEWFKSYLLNTSLIREMRACMT